VRQKPPNAGRGRRKGSQNKATKAFKHAVLAVYAELGGNAAMLAWAKKYPTEFYKVCARLIPHEHQVSGELRMPVPVDEFHED
jgi:hypothetical protein